MSDPRSVAQSILHERRFHRSSFPQPLRKPLHELGDDLRPVGRAISSSAHRVGDVFGSALVGWIILGGAFAAVCVLIARRFGARVQRRAVARADEDRPPGLPSRRDLEREAAAAERAGRYAEAVRLRFSAGLAGLADRGVVDERPSLRRGEVSASLHSERFDELADTFDAVAYGGRGADADDARTARDEWARVLDEARR